MTLTVTQRLALSALRDGKHRTRHEIRRAANLTSLNGATLRALVAARLIDCYDALDGPETYTITQQGRATLEARQ